MARFVETILYQVTPGEGAAFHNVMDKISLPIQIAHGLDVVGCGQSLHEADSCYLIRAYNSLEDFRNLQEKLYASEEWRKGPREGIVSRIVSSIKTVILMDEAAISALRQSLNQR